MGTAPADDALIRAAIGWDVRNWARALTLWQREIDLRRPRRALALGEHEGGLSLWLASRGIDVVCTDVDDSFETGARALHRRFGVADHVTYDVQDATAISQPDGSFDLVVVKSVLGALRTKVRQRQAIDEICRVLAPGGLFLFAENLVGSTAHAALRSRIRPLAGRLALPPRRSRPRPFVRLRRRPTGDVGRPRVARPHRTPARPSGSGRCLADPHRATNVALHPLRCLPESVNDHATSAAHARRVTATLSRCGS